MRVVATNSAGATDGADQSFKTQADTAPLPNPVLGVSVDAYPVSGQVFVLLPATATAGTSAFVAAAGGKGPLFGSLTKGKQFIPLTEARQLPVGTEFDTRKGTVRLTTASISKATYTGQFGAGVFKTLQSRQRKQQGLTVMQLLDGAIAGTRSYKQCVAAGKTKSKSGSASAEAAAAPRKLSSTVISLLKSQDDHGNFQTRGKYSSATVRGTKWDVEDRCDGTLTVVHRGLVAVQDFRTHKTVLVRAGHRFLAPAVGRPGKP